MIIKYCFLQCSFRCFWMPSQFCMIILVEGFYLHVSVRLLVQCMGSNFFSFLKCNITEWWKKYFFVTKVVPLLTFGLLSIALFLLLFLFFQLFSRWFGEAIHCGCKTKHLKKKKDPKGRTFGRGAQCCCAGMLFHINFVRRSWTFYFIMVGWRSCDGTCNCNFRYIFIFHFSQVSLTLFVQRFPLSFFGVGEECIIVKKKSDFRTVHICCFEDICIFVMCWKINTRKPTLQ